MLIAGVANAVVFDWSASLGRTGNDSDVVITKKIYIFNNKQTSH
jgi:hypothetical protein